MQKQVEIVVYQHSGEWHWRIDVNGKTDEDCSQGFLTMIGAATAAHKVYATRFIPAAY